MRYLKILLINFQLIFEQRGRALLWFVLSIINPLTLIVFWQGSIDSTTIIDGWSLADLNSYYIFLILVNNFLTSHIEEAVAYRDIQKGELVSKLVRPISYYWYSMLRELRYRLFQGFLGLVTATFLLFYFKQISLVQFNLTNVSLIATMFFLAFFICYTFKMILGIAAFWLTDVTGLFNTVVVIGIVFGGYVVPIHLFPDWLSKIAHLTPFPYYTYYPAVSLTGKLGTPEMINIIGIQLILLAILVLVYKKMWHLGKSTFTAVGQ